MNYLENLNSIVYDHIIHRVLQINLNFLFQLTHYKSLKSYIFIIINTFASEPSFEGKINEPFYFENILV